VLLFTTSWDLRHVEETAKNVTFAEIAADYTGE
jgi:hypothetical protein